jgi:TRAP transporter 4TM/12TM fusion protein
MGRFRGGPAKVSVISSGAFGTVSGSAVANVMVDGWLTIPLMMKSGYQPHFAAAVEATASTGGQIMPPVMGVTAFLMAELLGMPYAEIALSAFLPAILYYIAVFMQVDFEAGKRGLKGFPREILPQLRKALLDGWIFIIPVIVLFYTMFVLYMDADIAGLYSTVSALIVCMFKRRSRLTVKKFLLLLEAAGESLIEIGAVVGAAGLIIGVMSVSGLGFSFSMALTELAGGNMFVLLLLAAVSTTFLGMGMPVLPAYVLVSILVVPALTKMGMVPLCAHMFVFYYAVLSFLTPPICLSVYAAASIAKSKLMPTAFQALRLGIVAYIVPFIFAYSPTLLLIGTPAKVILSFILAILGVIMLSAGVEGYLFRDLKWFDRILAILGGMGVMIPLGWAEGLGGAIILILLFRQWVEKRSSRSRGI